MCGRPCRPDVARVRQRFAWSSSRSPAGLLAFAAELRPLSSLVPTTWAGPLASLRTKSRAPPDIDASAAVVAGHPDVAHHSLLAYPDPMAGVPDVRGNLI